jgi:hypothetical protein
MKITIAALVVASVIIAGLIIYAAWRISSHGEVRTVGVECDTKEIDWGVMNPNSTSQVIIHLWSNGTVPITVNMTAIEWQPAIAENYLAYTWNYSGAPIDTDPVAIAITLHVDEGVQGFRYFSNVLLIQAKESQ